MIWRNFRCPARQKSPETSVSGAVFDASVVFFVLQQVDYQRAENK